MRRTTVLASGLLGVTLAEAATALVAVSLVGGSYFARPDSTLTVSNVIIGVALALAGWPIGRHRPDNPIGWLLLGGGAGYALSGAGFAVLVAASPADPVALGWRLLAMITNAGWPPTIGMLLPLILLLFPDGRLPGPRWRGVAYLIIVNGLVFLALAVLPSQTLSSSAGVEAHGGWDWLDRQLGWLIPVNTILGIGAYLAALAALVLRYRAGDERVRRQLLWVLYGTGLMVLLSVISTAFDLDSLVLGPLPVTLIPISIAIAILKDQLLDIRLVLSRSVLYLILTVGVVATYVGLVAWLDAVVRQRTSIGTSVVATLVIAAAFNPVRIWLQRRIDRWLYGARRDPVRAVAEVGARLADDADPAAGLSGVLQALCQVMRLPAAWIVVDGEAVAGHGSTDRRQSRPLRLGSTLVGELAIGLRPGESRLSAADDKLLGLVTASLAVAVRAATLARDLEQAQTRLVTARDQERTRLQRDLHDGLGPPLTAVVLEAAAAQRLVASDPQQAAALMADVRSKVSAVVDDVRRLVSELRPPALEEVGLVAAIRRHAATLTSRFDGSPLRVTVEAGPAPGRLPPAVEIAAYRITTEALTNVARHSAARTATVRISADDSDLTVMIRDDGCTADEQPWSPGVGLTSIRERTGELGGSFRAGPDQHGGLVAVTLPVREE